MKMWNLRWLTMASVLLMGSVLADDARPAAVPAAAPAAQPAGSWIPHGPELPVMADFRRQYSACLKRLVVEPWQKQGGRPDELELLSLYCDAKSGQDDTAFSKLKAKAGAFRDETRHPYIRGMACSFLWTPSQSAHLNLLAAMEGCYEKVAAEPQLTETAKALFALQAVEFHLMGMEYISHPGCLRWTERVHRHVLAAWDKQEFQQAEQPFLFNVIEHLPGRAPKLQSAKTLGGLVNGFTGKEANYPWLALMLKSKQAHNSGWEARGGGYADSVTEAGSKEFDKQQAEADRLARQAWTLNPEWPESAALILNIGSESGFPKGETAREWFLRAVTKRFDWSSPYAKMMWFNRPRWGGSHEQMLEFGQACFDTRRFDTNVPHYYATALNEAATEYPYYLFRTPFRQAGVALRLNELYEEQLKQEKEPRKRNLLIAQQVCCNVWCGNHEKAKELLARLDPNDPFYNVFAGFQKVFGRWQLWSRREVEDEIVAYTSGPFKERLQEMSRALYDDPKKGVELAAALAKDAKAAKDPRTQRIAMDVAGWALYPETTGENPNSGWSAIHIAVMENKADLVRKLVEMGEDPDRRGSPLVGYRTPLAYAFLKKKPEMVRLLIELGADPFLESASDRPQNPFYDALGAQDMTGIKAMIDAGLKLKDKKLFCQNYLAWGWMARRGGSLPMLSYVFDNKLMDPSMVVWEETGYALLHNAATDASFDEVRFLLKSGADNRVKDKNGKTPAELAKDPQIRELLQRGIAKEQEEEKKRQAAVWLRKYDFNGNGVLDPEERARAEKESQAGIQAPANDE